MGGEWFYYRKSSEQDPKPTKPLDLKNYQELLLQLKSEYQTQFNKKHVKWCDDISTLPPADNVFARFKFSCSRHGNWNEPDHPWCNLYWDGGPIHNTHSSLHDRCEGTDGFNVIALFKIQRKIVETFPGHFRLYREWTDTATYDSNKIKNPIQVDVDDIKSLWYRQVYLCLY